MPLRGLDGVGPAERVVVFPVLDVGLGEDAHAAELAGLSGAMSGGQQDLWSDEGAGAAERRLPADVHHEEDDGGMGIPVERAVGDERGAIGVSGIRGTPVAAEQAEAGGGQDRDDETCPHGASLSGWDAIVTPNGPTSQNTQHARRITPYPLIRGPDLPAKSLTVARRVSEN